MNINQKYILLHQIYHRRMKHLHKCRYLTRVDRIVFRPAGNDCIHGYFENPSRLVEGQRVFAAKISSYWARAPTVYKPYRVYRILPARHLHYPLPALGFAATPLHDPLKQPQHEPGSPSAGTSARAHGSKLNLAGDITYIETDQGWLYLWPLSWMPSSAQKTGNRGSYKLTGL